MPWILGQLIDESVEPDRRSEPRRRLRLDVPVRARSGSRSGGQDVVRVLDLSCAGMMIHCTADLRPGEHIAVILPQAGCVDAEVVWKRMTLLGCSFAAPISQSAITAMSLLSASAEEPKIA